jgi:hypothetical protein
MMIVYFVPGVRLEMVMLRFILVGIRLKPPLLGVIVNASKTDCQFIWTLKEREIFTSEVETPTLPSGRDEDIT